MFMATFKKSLAKKYYECLSNGKPILATGSKLYGLEELLTLAGVCQYLLEEQEEIEELFKTDEEKSKQTSETLETLGGCLPDEVSDAISWASAMCGHIFEEELNDYDQDFEETVRAVFEHAVSFDIVSGEKEITEDDDNDYDDE